MAGRVITVAQQKGGSGKTTVAVNLAVALRGRGVSVALLDTDPQGSMGRWYLERLERRGEDEALEFGTSSAWGASYESEKLRKRFDYVIIDAPPQVSSIARSIILAADLILIPVQPSPHDIWSAAEIVKLIEDATAFKENIKAAFVVNRKIANTALGRDVFTALENYPFPVLDTAVCQRVAFAESAAVGSTVLETEPNSPAALEVLSLTREALEITTHDEADRPRRRRQEAR